MPAPRVTSLPVPAVVGMAMMGAAPAAGGVAFGPEYRRNGAGLRASVATALALSITEPPPTATRPSQSSARIASSARSTPSSVGFSGTSSNTAPGVAAGTASRTIWNTPHAAMPGSVMNSGRSIPQAASSSASAARAPNSK